MYVENLVFDAVEPQRLGRFWEAVVGADRRAGRRRDVPWRVYADPSGNELCVLPARS